MKPNEKQTYDDRLNQEVTRKGAKGRGFPHDYPEDPNAPVCKSTPGQKKPKES